MINKLAALVALQPQLLNAEKCEQLGISCPLDAGGGNLTNYILSFIKPALAPPTPTLGIIGTLFTAALVYGSAMYVISAGDEARAHKAKMVIIFAVIGLLIVGAAAIVVNVVVNLP